MILLGGAGGVDYNGTSSNFEYPPDCPSCTYQRIVFRDTPGFHAVDESGAYTNPLIPGTYEVSYQFWTSIYDKQDYREYAKSEDPFAVQPIYVVPWCFKAELTVP